MENDRGYMFRLVLAILLRTNSDSGYMFRLVLGILLHIDNGCS